MSKKSEVQLSGYNAGAYIYIIRGKMNILRSRLLNLADSISSDKEQRNAIKGLIKDFCGETYYPLIEEIEDYLTFFKIIDNSNGYESVPRLEDVKRID